MLIFLILLAPPQAKYFGLGNLCRDQLESYAQRNNLTLAEAEKWLSPNLNDDV